MKDSSSDLSSTLKLAAIPLSRLVLRAVDLAQSEFDGADCDASVRFVAEVSAEPIAIQVDETAIDAILNRLLSYSLEILPAGGSITLKTGMIESEGIQEVSRTRPPSYKAYLDLNYLGPVLNLAFWADGVPSFLTVDENIEIVVGSEAVNTENKSGLTVRLMFPASERIISQVAAYSSPSLGEHILLIDDDPILLRVVHQILAADGHEVVVASGGKEGIEAYGLAFHSGKPFRIVITDFNMPGLDGDEVAKAIKAISPKIPVILLSASDYHVEQAGQSAHFDVVLRKPAKAIDLRNAIAQCRRRKEAA